MTAPNQFHVDLAQIRAHASTVGDFANRLSSVAAGQSGGPADTALGTFVQFLAAGLQDAATKTTSAIADASTAVGNVSAGLAGTADGYQRTDEQNAARLRQEVVR